MCLRWTEVAFSNVDKCVEIEESRSLWSRFRNPGGMAWAIGGSFRTPAGILRIDSHSFLEYSPERAGRSRDVPPLKSGRPTSRKLRCEGVGDRARLGIVGDLRLGGISGMFPGS